MALFSSDLAGLIAHRHGIVTVDQLVADGTTLNTVWMTETPIGLAAHDRTPIRQGVTLRRTNRGSSSASCERSRPEASGRSCASIRCGWPTARSSRGTDLELAENFDRAIDDLVELYRLRSSEVRGSAA